MHAGGRGQRTDGCSTKRYDRATARVRECTPSSGQPAQVRARGVVPRTAGGRGRCRTVTPRNSSGRSEARVEHGDNGWAARSRRRRQRMRRASIRTACSSETRDVNTPTRCHGGHAAIVSMAARAGRVVAGRDGNQRARQPTRIEAAARVGNPSNRVWVSRNGQPHHAMADAA